MGQPAAPNVHTDADGHRRANGDANGDYHLVDGDADRDADLDTGDSDADGGTVKREAGSGKRRRRRKGTGFTSTIRASATRKAEYENRLGLTWRSRPGTLRERDFAAVDRNLRGVSRMKRKLERLMFGRQRKKPESSAYDFVGKEI